MNKRKRLEREYSEKYGKACRLRYVRGNRGAMEGRGWYLTVFGETERKVLV
jgi:hypothetical protein